MITAGTYPPISIDFGSNEAGMTLQYRDRLIWRDVVQDGDQCAAVWGLSVRKSRQVLTGLLSGKASKPEVETIETLNPAYPIPSSR